MLRHRSFDLQIRPEREQDCDAIDAVISSAFQDMPFADGDESDLVARLRSEGALSLSLVAELDGAVIGQIAFSPARPADGSPHWYALGPVAVLPPFQREGVGTALIRNGLQAISELGGCGCILTGDPHYYTRFGFELSPAHTPPGEPEAYYMVKALRGPVPDGAIFFHEAFGSSG